MKSFVVMMIVMCGACSHVSVNKTQTMSVKDDAVQIEQMEEVRDVAQSCNEDSLARGTEKCRKAYAAYAILAQN